MSLPSDRKLNDRTAEVILWAAHSWRETGTEPEDFISGRQDENIFSRAGPGIAMATLLFYNTQLSQLSFQILLNFVWSLHIFSINDV